MDAWEAADVESARTAAGGRDQEFLRVPDLSAGLDVLEAGAADPQSAAPRTSSTTSSAARPGDSRRGDPGRGRRIAVFVAARVLHRFHDIAEDLEILVVFGPAEGDRG